MLTQVRNSIIAANHTSAILLQCISQESKASSTASSQSGGRNGGTSSAGSCGAQPQQVLPSEASGSTTAPGAAASSRGAVHKSSNCTSLHSASSSNYHNLRPSATADQQAAAPVVNVTATVSPVGDEDNGQQQQLEPGATSSFAPPTRRIDSTKLSTRESSGIIAGGGTAQGLLEGPPGGAGTEPVVSGDQSVSGSIKTSMKTSNTSAAAAGGSSSSSSILRNIKNEVVAGRDNLFSKSTSQQAVEEISGSNKTTTSTKQPVLKTPTTTTAKVLTPTGTTQIVPAVDQTILPGDGGDVEGTAAAQIITGTNRAVSTTKKKEKKSAVVGEVEGAAPSILPTTEKKKKKKEKEFVEQDVYDENGNVIGTEQVQVKKKKKEKKEKKDKGGVAAGMNRVDTAQEKDLLPVDDQNGVD